MTTDPAYGSGSSAAGTTSTDAPTDQTSADQTSGDSAAPAPPPPPGDDLFERLRRSGPLRPAEGRWAAGVCAGIARRYDLDVVLVRGVTVVLAVIGGIGFLLYGLAWLFLPQDDGRAHAQQVLRGDVTAGFVGAALLTVVSFGSPGIASADGGFWLGPVGLLLVLVLVVVLWARGGRSSTAHPPAAPSAASPGTPGAAAPYPPGAAGVAPFRGDVGDTPGVLGWGPPPPPPGHPHVPAAPPPPVPQRPDLSAPSHVLTRVTLGVALLAAAGAVAWHRLVDAFDEPGLVAVAVAVAVLGVGAVVAGARGRRSGALAPIGVLLALGLLVGASTPPAGTSVGSRDWRPATAAEASDGYRLGVGDATLDLRDPAVLRDAAAGEPLEVDATVGAGELRLLVPEGVPAVVRGSVGAGQLVSPDGDLVDGPRRDGPGVSRTLSLGPAGEPVLVVDAEVGIGELQVITVAAAPSGGPTTPSTPSPAPVPSPAASTPLQDVR